jgi:membrane protein YdbS with pleckstrin-like domain
LVPEPGFYDGAMYISYAFSVALMITSLVAINVLVEDPELWMYLTLVVVLTIFLMPAMLRYSKTLYQYGLGKLKYRGF